MKTGEIAAVVAAAASSRGIGIRGQLPWKIPADMKYFRELTSKPPSPELKNAVIMGRKTWESIPFKFRPLPNRTNVVLTTQTSYDSGSTSPDVLLASSLADATAQISKLDDVGTIFIIGGQQVYQSALDAGVCTKVYYTEVKGMDDGEFDAFFPALEDSQWTRAEVGEGGTCGDLTYQFLEYTRSSSTLLSDTSTAEIPEGADLNPDEMQYLQTCRRILDSGIRRGDRTGTGTLSLFGTQMRFNLRDGTLPLLTTKRTFWRGVAEELLWFIKGSTNAKELQEKNIHIWDGNASREFLDGRGLSGREVGDLGPVYGFQWRHFGAEYTDMHADYTGKGIDQLAQCIHTIKTNPEDRRIIMSAWNPSDLNDMALPPCHLLCQFYVDTTRKELSCQMYQRSADMGLGVPFNIASYALLTHLVAHVCGLTAGDFVHSIGDAHVYSNHVDALEEQLTRKPRVFPKLRINKPADTDIDGFVYEDLEVVGYTPHKSIKMKMAV